MHHVNQKLLFALAGAVALTAVAAAWLLQSRQSAETGAEASYALPALRGRVPQAAAITIQGPGGPLITLTNGPTGWNVKEKGGYPADTVKLRGLLLNLADAKLVEPKTQKPEHYAELGVQDLSDPQAKGLLVSVEGLNEPVQLIIGNAATHGKGSYVRLPGQAQSWLTDIKLSVDREPGHWLQNQLTDIAPERIASISLTQPDGKTIKLAKAKPGDADFELIELPPGRELSMPGVLNSLASTLSGLTLLDLKTDLNPPAGKTVHAHYQTFDGVSVDAEAWKDSAQFYARFDAKLDEALAEKAAAEANPEPDKAQANAEAGKTETKSEDKQEDKPESKTPKRTLKDLRDEVEQLKQRFDGRTFQIPGFKYDNMNKNLEMLLKPLSAK